MATAASLSTLLLLLAALVAAAPPVVRTRQGAVRGLSKATSAGRPFLAFYQLPYASPPVGPLRFRNPQPPGTWEHIRDATTHGPDCTQDPFLGISPHITGTEDCLYLNVFTPKVKPTELYPVMVWIHGGGWITGGSMNYEPGPLLDFDVVLVTINYRLGPLGFLSTEDEAAPGNFGLKDQAAALRWVKENIEAFGGDPGRVTIFGESAGGASVHYHMLSPLSRGLFHRAVSQSGVALAPWALSQSAAEKARKVADLLGCPTEPSAALVECLRFVDDYEIVATQKHFLKWHFHPLVTFRPVIEGEGEHSFLPKHPLDLEPPVAVPWLTGVTRDEGCIVTATFSANATLLQQLEADEKRLLPLTLMYDTSPDVDTITEKIQDFYFSTNGISLSTLSDVYSDGFFTLNADEAVRKYKNIAPVYYYLFSYEGKRRFSKFFGAKDDLGVCHADDLFYLFPDNTLIPIEGERSAEDIEVATTMMKLWTNFAASGNPTPNDNPLHWPRASSDGELEYLDIGKTLKVEKGLFQERVNFWQSLHLRGTEQHNADRDEL